MLSPAMLFIAINSDRFESLLATLYRDTDSGRCMVPVLVVGKDFTREITVAQVRVCAGEVTNEISLQ